MTSIAAPSPLRISCGSYRCGPQVAPPDQRHAFTTTVGQLPGIGGACRNCGEGPIDWLRHHARDPADVEALIGAMRQELIRDVYWSEALPKRILRLARARKTHDLRASHTRLLARVLVPTEVEFPYLRKQTYFADHADARIVHCAQHATATCCRACLETWHGIPRDERVGQSHLAYLEPLVWLYTERRLTEPEVPDVLAA
jgi:hypothetical protein